MKIILTPHLLEFLIAEGYNYFLSRTFIFDVQNPFFYVSLLPVKKKPVISKYSLIYKTYFSVNQKFWQLAMSGSAKVWVTLAREDIPKLKQSLLEVVKNRSSESGRLKSMYLLKRVNG